MKTMPETKKSEYQEAYIQVRILYQNKLVFTKQNCLNKRIEEFKGNGEKIFDLMYDIIANVK